MLPPSSPMAPLCMVFSIEGASSGYLMLLTFYNGLSCVFVLWILFSLLANKRLELEVAVMSQLLEEEKKQDTRRK